MPAIEFDGETVEADEGDTLRRALLDAGIWPYNGKARYTNCRGNAICGTCSVEIVDGETSEPTKREARRLKLPPHNPDSGLRLACQVTIEDNLVVEKHGGYWGQKVDSDDA